MSVCRLQPIYNYYKCIFICDSYKMDHNKLVYTFLLFILSLESKKKKKIPRFSFLTFQDFGSDLSLNLSFTHKLGLRTPNISGPMPFHPLNLGLLRAREVNKILHGNSSHIAAGQTLSLFSRLPRYYLPERIYTALTVEHTCSCKMATLPINSPSISQMHN